MNYISKISNRERMAVQIAGSTLNSQISIPNDGLKAVNIGISGISVCIGVCAVSNMGVWVTGVCGVGADVGDVGLGLSLGLPLASVVAIAGVVGVAVGFVGQGPVGGIASVAVVAGIAKGSGVSVVTSVAETIAQPIPIVGVSVSIGIGGGLGLGSRFGLAFSQVMEAGVGVVGEGVGKE